VSPVQASLQKVFIECLETMLRPIVRLTLYCGLGHREFAAAVRRVFIDVASYEYGVRGRPANVAKISAKTGLPRKVIRSYRDFSGDSEWTPDNETSPINTLIHYWHFDERFCVERGTPRRLPYKGTNSFSMLAKSYGGDIPISTIRQELLHEGITTQDEQGVLTLQRRYSFPERLDEDFLRNAAFSIRHLGDSLVHNATIVNSGKASEALHREHGRFERYAWSRRLDQNAVQKFQFWVRKEGARFVQQADEYIAQLEDLRPEGSDEQFFVGGVGLYFFREE